MMGVELFVQVFLDGPNGFFVTWTIYYQYTRNYSEIFAS